MWKLHISASAGDRLSTPVLLAAVVMQKCSSDFLPDALFLIPLNCTSTSSCQTAQFYPFSSLILAWPSRESLFLSHITYFHVIKLNHKYIRACYLNDDCFQRPHSATSAHLSAGTGLTRMFHESHRLAWDVFYTCICAGLYTHVINKGHCVLCFVCCLCFWTNIVLCFVLKNMVTYFIHLVLISKW